MLLNGLYSITHSQPVSIRTAGETIRSVSFAGTQKKANDPVLEFSDAIVFPGLINSHDHLDFNLFPSLGHRVYNNYVEWGNDIHRADRETIANVLKVPKHLRELWGAYKNLLAGVTTVVNHGPKVSLTDAPVNVWESCHVLHSVQVEKKWKLKLNFPYFDKQPFAIHVGEGTDEGAGKEIDRLLQWNLFRRDLIGIHGVAMRAEQASRFKALVWCPASNFFLLGKTAHVSELKKQTRLLFGTDSTVSAGWNLWEHLRLAKQGGQSDDKELLHMLTVAPAETWPVNNCGRLEENHYADLVVARNRPGLSSADGFSRLDPEDILLVMVRGKIMLFDEELREQAAHFLDLRNYSPVLLNGSRKNVAGDLPALMRTITAYYPKALFPVAPAT